MTAANLINRSGRSAAAGQISTCFDFPAD